MSHRYAPQFPDETGFNYSWAGRPRGMGRKEATVWAKYREQYPEQFSQVWYDVNIPGSGTPMKETEFKVPGIDKKWSTAWTRLTELRIDCVAMSAGRYTIIEVKTLGTEHVFGQVSRYRLLARAAWPGLEFARSLIVIGEWSVGHLITPAALDSRVIILS